MYRCFLPSTNVARYEILSVFYDIRYWVHSSVNNRVNVDARYVQQAFPVDNRPWPRPGKCVPGW